jgi:hypothetical protein
VLTNDVDTTGSTAEKLRRNTIELLESLHYVLVTRDMLLLDVAIGVVISIVQGCQDGYEFPVS